MPSKDDTPKRNTFILPKYPVEPEYPPRHKIGQLGRLKQDCPIAWIFPSNRINSQGSIAALQDSYKASLQDSHKNGCEMYTPSKDGGGRSRFILSFIFYDTPSFIFGPRSANLGSRRSRGDGNPASHETGKENSILSVMGSRGSPSHK